MTTLQATFAAIAGAALALAAPQQAGAAVLTTAPLVATATESNQCTAVNVSTATIATVLVEVVDANTGTVAAMQTCNGLLPSQSCGATGPLGSLLAFCRFTPAAGAKRIRANQMVIDSSFEVRAAADAQ